MEFKNAKIFENFVSKNATTRNKDHLIVEKAREKAVLDIGCLGHSWKVIIESPNSTFQKLRKVSSEIVGVDFLETDVEKVNRLGYHEIVYGDATNLNLGKTFDVIILG
jgi:hypothetical protein